MRCYKCNGSGNTDNKTIYELIEAIKEVLKISDKNNNAWNKAKNLIEEFEKRNATARN